MPVAKDLTELVEINPSRVDLVRTPASGFPILVMKAAGAVAPEGCCDQCGPDCMCASASKAVNAQGGIDEKPDIDGAEHVLQMLARLIQSEASEMAVGNWDEICDINLLAEAAHLMMCFHRMETYGDEDDGDSIMKSADFPSADELESAVTCVLKRKVSSAERKRLASEGKALPDGSYPIENAEDLHNAAILARSGHGDVAAAKRLIAKRAKELGVANPLAESTAKDTTEVPTETSTPESTPETVPAETEKSLPELVADEVAKAVKPLAERNKALEDEMAALKATPIPGEPAVTAPVTGAAPKDATVTKEIARFERLAKDVQDRELARYYADRAAELQAGK